MNNVFHLPASPAPGRCPCGAPSASEGPRGLCATCARKREDALREWNARAEQTTREAMLNSAKLSIPEAFRWAFFVAPDLVARVKRPEAITEAKAALEASGVVLVGAAGAGKTSVACAMLAELIRQAASGPPKDLRFAGSARFIGAYWLAKARAEHPLGDGEAPLVQLALGASVLVLDDLGAEQSKNTALSEVIYERHAKGQRTIITTGFGYRVLQQRYGDGIARRIVEEGRTVVIRCGRETAPESTT